MRRLLYVAGVMAVGAFLATGLAQQPNKPVEKSKIVEVAVLEGAGKYSFPKADVGLIRITPQAAAGSDIKHTVEGPAKLQGINRVGMWMPGEGGPAVGADGREYVIEPTGAGTVIVTFDVKSPGSDEAEEQQYVIRIR